MALSRLAPVEETLRELGEARARRFCIAHARLRRAPFALHRRRAARNRSAAPRSRSSTPSAPATASCRRCFSRWTATARWAPERRAADSRLSSPAGRGFRGSRVRHHLHAQGLATRRRSTRSRRLRAQRRGDFRDMLRRNFEDGATSSPAIFTKGTDPPWPPLGPRRKPRPLSPHLDVYRMTLTMAMSIVHRITGVGLYIGVMLARRGFSWRCRATPRPSRHFSGFIRSFIGQVRAAGFHLGAVSPHGRRLAACVVGRQGSASTIRCAKWLAQGSTG